MVLAMDPEMNRVTLSTAPGRTRWRTAVLAGIVGALVTWLALHFGLWWGSFVVGVLLGLGVRGGLRIVLGAGLGGLLGWGLPLTLRGAEGQPVVPVAKTLAGILGMGTSTGAGLAILGVMGLIGLMLMLCGAWLGAAVRRLRQV